MTVRPAMRKDGGRQGAGTVEQKAARGPCPECGALLVAPGRAGAKEGGEEGYRESRQGGQDNYIKSLQQQIKILELEVSFLKRQGEGEGRAGRQQQQEPVKEVGEKREVVREVTAGQGETVKMLQGELQQERTRVEQLRIEKGKVGDRLKQAEAWREEERSKAVAIQARLEGREEELERTGEQREARMAGLLNDLERQTIVSKDRERAVLQLQEEVQAHKEESTRAGQQLEQMQGELASRQTAVQGLQEKFLQSSQHILQVQVVSAN